MARVPSSNVSIAYESDADVQCDDDLQQMFNADKVENSSSDSYYEERKKKFSIVANLRYIKDILLQRLNLDFERGNERYIFLARYGKQHIQNMHSRVHLQPYIL